MSLYILDRNKYEVRPKHPPIKNPYKGKRKTDESNVPPDVYDKYSQQILDLVLYDAEDCQALRDFEPVKMNTHCIFAKNSVLWGSKDYDRNLSLGKCN